MKNKNFDGYILCYGRTDKFLQQKCLRNNHSSCSDCILEKKGFKNLGNKVIRVKLGRVLILDECEYEYE